jgi:hypothetical protein
MHGHVEPIMVTDGLSMGLVMRQALAPGCASCKFFDVGKKYWLQLAELR